MKKIIVVFAISLISVACVSQEKKESVFKKGQTLIGIDGLSFGVGKNYFGMSLSPSFGYHLTDRWVVESKLNLEYASQKNQFIRIGLGGTFGTRYYLSNLKKNTLFYFSSSFTANYSRALKGENLLFIPNRTDLLWKNMLGVEIKLAPRLSVFGEAGYQQHLNRKSNYDFSGFTGGAGLRFYLNR